MTYAFVYKNSKFKTLLKCFVVQIKQTNAFSAFAIFVFWSPIAKIHTRPNPNTLTLTVT